MTQQDGLLLTVTAGPQKGASLLLKADGLYRVGTEPSMGFDVLLQGVEEPFVIVVDTTPGQESIQLQEGVIFLGKRAVKPGATVRIKKNEVLTASNVEMELEIASARAASEVSTQDVSVGSSLMFILAGVVLIAGSAMALVAQNDTDDSVYVERPSLPQALVNASLDMLTVSEDEDGNIHISGLLPDEELAISLDGLVADRPEPIVLSTLTVPELIASVEEYYRINGIKASVVLSANGGERSNDLLVTTRDVETARLLKLEADIKNDIPLIGEIVRDNTPPVAKKQSLKKPARNIDNDVLLIVAGRTPYVLTREGGRYFEGSILPDGHLVEKIERNSVVLKKGDEKFQVGL